MKDADKILQNLSKWIRWSTRAASLFVIPVCICLLVPPALNTWAAVTFTEYHLMMSELLIFLLLLPFLMALVFGILLIRKTWSASPWSDGRINEFRTAALLNAGYYLLITFYSAVGTFNSYAPDPQEQQMLTPQMLLAQQISSEALRILFWFSFAGLIVSAVSLLMIFVYGKKQSNGLEKTK